MAGAADDDPELDGTDAQSAEQVSSEPEETGEQDDETPEQPRTGRLSFLDDEAMKPMVDAFLDAVEAGNYVGDAIAESGLKKGQVYRALRKGKFPKAPKKYRLFRNEVFVRRRKARSRLVTILANAAVDNPHYAEVLLRALDPDRFNPQVATLVSNGIKEFFGRLQKGLTPDEFARVVRVAAGRDAGAPLLPAGRVAVDGKPGDPGPGSAVGG